MSTFNFIPQTDAGKALWLKNFSNKLPQFTAKYNITPAELADVQQNAVAFDYWVNFKNQGDEFNKKLTKYKNEVRDGIKVNATPSILPVLPSVGTPPPTNPGVFVRITAVIHRIKKHLVYTHADGLDLGIELVAAQQADLNSAKPSISVRLIDGGIPEIVWTKNGMTALEIHVDRGDGYELLEVDTNPNYKDTFALETGTSAIWKYKAVYRKKDNRVGQWSDEVSFTATGL